MYIFWAKAAGGRHIRQGVIVVLPIVNEPGHMFAQSSVEDNTMGFNGWVELEHLSNMWVENDSVMAFANVSTTGLDYFQMVFMHFSDGGPWLDDTEKRAIVCEELAWALFGSVDVVGLTMRIGGELYTISGVAQDVGPATADGFAWIPRGSTAQNGNILYLRQYSYNPITAHLAADEILTAMHRRPQNYTITDMNIFLNSMALRGRVLLALISLFILFFAVKLTYHLLHNAKTAIDWAIAATATIVSIGVAVFTLPHITIDLWIPAFAGDGIQGYARLFFNTGLLAPRQYLPGNLAALYDYNLRANVAFGVGIAGLIGCVSIFSGAAK